MEFLNTCTTNAQAIGDFEVIAFQAFSISRSASPSPADDDDDWSASDDIRAVEADLRQGAHWVTQDATRPWLWLFKPTRIEDADQGAIELPQVHGYQLQHEQAGRIKAIELARPPLRTPHPTASSNFTAPPASAPQKGLQSGGARLPQSHSQANPPEQLLPDSNTIYHLLTSSVIGLLSYTLVRDCGVVALNYRTFVSRPPTLYTPLDALVSSPVDMYWLTSISAHWTSSGTFLVSTITQRNRDMRCLDRIEHVRDQAQLLGKVIRVAPNGILATIVTFVDPLDSTPADTNTRSKKRQRTTTLEQSISKWKATVTRWLGWRGFTLPDLENRASWVRIRSNQPTSCPLLSPTSSHEWDVLWPRALCFFYHKDCMQIKTRRFLGAQSYDFRTSVLRWFQTADAPGYRNPFQIAQEWALGKPLRDELLETKRRERNAEKDAAHIKEESTTIPASSPMNTRNSVYGDLQAVSGVYPTPPDAMAPLSGTSYGDTPSVFGGTSNVILAPGGSNPAINLKAPQKEKQTEMHGHLMSPALPSAPDHVTATSGNDDLFGDMEEEGFEGSNINEEDFDFFDAPDDEDTNMLDPSAYPGTNMAPAAFQSTPQQPTIAAKSPFEKGEPDPSEALENALVTASLPKQRDSSGGESLPRLPEEATPADTAVNTTMLSNDQLFKNEAENTRNGAKSPLDPIKIVQTLPSTSTDKATPQEKKQSSRPSRERAFDPLQFDRKMSLTDAKYQDGRFATGRENETIERRVSLVSSELQSLRDVPLMAKLRYTTGVASAARIPEITALVRAASDNTASSSEGSEDSEEDTEEEADANPMAFLTGFSIPSKRKQPTDGNATPMSVTSFAESWGGDGYDLQGLQFDEAHLACFEPSSWDWSLVFLSNPSERSSVGARFSMPALTPCSVQLPDTPTSQPESAIEEPEESSLSGKDIIIIAQIITNQIVSATLDILNEDASFRADPGPLAYSETRWHVTIKAIFPDAMECTVPAFAGVHDVFPEFQAQGKGQQRPPPKKQNESTAPGSQMFPLNPPYVRVRRAEAHWELLPTAVAFWEHLGLSPASPCKNVVAFCIYPQSKSLKPCIEGFLLNLQLAYDSCRLGSHTRAETVVEFEGGLIPCEVTNPVSERDVFKALKDSCIQLGRLLAVEHTKIQEQQEDKIDAFVIYIVDPFSSPSALWELCQSFWALFQAYGQGSLSRLDQSQKPDLVLQVVPMKYVASFDAPVVLDLRTYVNLAREVYDRCPPNAPSGDKTCLSIYAAPALQLEETIPRSIPFKLLSEPPQDLLRENCYMHLGYAISLDGTWITAAWTDTCGKSQAVVSYHLGTRAFGEMAKEIWQTTIEILQSRRVHWRVCIAKAGVMDREELEAWVSLISCPAQLNLFITLLTVDVEPSLRFTPTTPPAASVSATHTPTSTPQPDISPDSTGGLTPAATPSATTPSADTPSADTADPSLDPEARLVDISDESWGITLAHRLHNSNSTNQFSPALISGLLVKRGQTHATKHSTSNPLLDLTPGPIVVAVNILWIGAVGSTRTASPFPSANEPPSPLATSANANTSTSSSSATGTNASATAIGSTTPHSPATSAASSADGPRSTSSLMWTPTAQTRSTAENLLKEILIQFRGLGLLARCRGMRGTRHGSVPWHVVAAKNGVEGLERVMNGGV